MTLATDKAALARLQAKIVAYLGDDIVLGIPIINGLSRAEQTKRRRDGRWEMAEAFRYCAMAEAADDETFVAALREAAENFVHSGMASAAAAEARSAAAEAARTVLRARQTANGKKRGAQRTEETLSRDAADFAAIEAMMARGKPKNRAIYDVATADEGQVRSADYLKTKFNAHIKMRRRAG